jgi:hypothetical protein
MKSILLVVLLVVALVLIVVFGPIAVIYALNTLFGLSIPIYLETWLSVVIIYFFLNAASSTSISIKK